MFTFPASAFPATTILGKTEDVEKEGGDSRLEIVSSETIMGNVQDAAAIESMEGLTRGFTFNTIIYYPRRINAEPDDVIEWVEGEHKYRVVAEREEASFGALWAVYCTRVQ